ncbi:MAG: FAD-dependent monooxygenase, partial [Gammaproteobacteria bacterium]
SERKCFPLKMRHAKQYVQSGIALIGDAVRTVHPLAGQGLNLGLLDSATLAEVVTKAYQADRNYASLANLRKYERWRKGHNMLMITAMAALKRLFANDPPVISRLRNEGLNLTHRLSPVKTLLMRHAMGIKGDLPVIAQ